jgi:CheY-like chemotaxis protein
MRAVHARPGGRGAWPPRPPRAAGPVLLDGRRVCFAEDGPDNQRLFALHLRKAGAEVSVARPRPRCAVAKLDPADAATRVDLIITDMQMPEMDGYELAAALRDKGWRAGVLALTAHAMKGDDQRCFDAGCSAYLTKPVDRQQLVLTCLEALGTEHAPCARAA